MFESILFIVLITVWLLWTDQNVLAAEKYYTSKTNFLIWLYISFNKPVKTFQKGFTQHTSEVIMNLAWVGFLCKFGVQHLLQSFFYLFQWLEDLIHFSEMTYYLIEFYPLVAFIYVVILLTLLRSNSLIKTLA